MARSVVLALLGVVAIVGCDKSSGGTYPPPAEAVEEEPVGEDGDEPEQEVEEIDTATKIEGGLTEEQLQAVVEENVRPVRECFDAALTRMASENLIGAIVVEFSVTKAGRVQGAQVVATNFGDQEAGACIIASLEEWIFPKPKKGKPAKVRYAFHLRSY